MANVIPVPGQKSAPNVSKGKSLKPHLDSKQKSKLSLKSGINLLTDTGVALRIAMMKRRLYRSAALIIGIIFLFSGATFSFWYLTNQQQTNIEKQIKTLEQQMAGYTEENRMASVYSQRLNKIKGLIKGKNTNQLPWTQIHELLNISKSTNSQLNSYKYSKNKISASFTAMTIGDMNKLLNLLEEIEISNKWSDIVITQLSRTNKGSYKVEFSATIKS